MLATTAPRTEAVRRVLSLRRDDRTTADLLFLESWESADAAGVGATLRARQIRRANPRLAAEIRAELHPGRALTEPDRAALASPD